MNWKLALGFLTLGVCLATSPAFSSASPIDTPNLKQPVLAQTATTAKIVGVKVEQINGELEIQLETDGGNFSPQLRTEGNRSIAEITATLALPDNSPSFRVETPAPDITAVEVAQVGGTVIVTAIGRDTPPKTAIKLKIGGQSYALNPATGTEPELEVNVIGQRALRNDYRRPNLTTGSKTDAPVRDLPFSVQVVPQEVLRDRQVESVNEALRTVAGVTPDNSSYSAFEGFTIRGFSGSFTGRDILRNGLRDATNITTRIAIPNVEQIEVLKGPAGSLFSQGSPGGTVNIITKKPQFTPSYRVEGTIGNNNTYRGSVDLTGPLNESKTLAYRLITAADSTQTFIDFFDRRNYLIAPSVTWQATPTTKVTFEGEYTIGQQPNARGLPAAGTVLPNVNGKLPRNRFIGEPDDNLDKNDRYALRVGYNLDHKINSDWQVNNAFRASITRTPQNSLFPSELLADGRTLERGLFSTSDQRQDNYLFDTNVVGNFKTGDIAHQLLVGIDDNHDIYSASNQQFALAPIDIFNPVYGQPRGALIAEFPSEPFTTKSFGIYLQDRLELSPNFKILAGGRFSWVSQEGSGSSQGDGAFSPRLGLVYQPTKDLSVYGSYSSSFIQSVGTAFDNTLFKPERGNQYEIGVKLDWYDKRLSSTLALFDITRSNVLTANPVNPNFSVQTGEQKSQGIELETQGEILPGWKVSASYAYTDAKISADNSIPVGNRINNVPANALSLFSTYELQSGNLKGLGFGLGVFYVGERQGDLANSFQVPGYTRTDASIFYRRDDFRAALSIENLFDVGYFEAVEGPLRVFYGAPFAIKGTVSWTF